MLAPTFVKVAAVLSIMLGCVAATPVALDSSSLVLRQEQMPSNCTNYCSVSAGCVCIIRPLNCVATYLSAAGETCGSVVDRFQNFTATALFKWNPEITQTCLGIIAYVPVCIGVTGYKFNGLPQAGDVEAASEIPVPIMPGIVPGCTKYVYISETGAPPISQILAQNGITQAQFTAWNYPNQNTTDPLSGWAGYWACVSL